MSPAAKTVTIPIYGKLDAQAQHHIGRIQRMKRRAAALLLSIAFILGFVLFLTAELVTDHLLDEDLYIQALAENDIYDRIYTELLADPEFAATTEALLADLNIDAGTSRELYSFTVSTLRLILPPERIEQAYERAIGSATAYLRGETPQLVARLDLSRALDDPAFKDNLIAQIQAYSSEILLRLQQGIDIADTRLDESARTAILEYVRELAEGHVGELPVDTALLNPALLTEEERSQFARDLLEPLGTEPPPELLRQVEAALAADDLLGAVSIASRAVLDVVVEQGIADLRQYMDEEGLDLMKELAALAEETEQSMVDQLNGVRAVVIGIDQGIKPLSALVMALSLAGVMFLYDDEMHLLLRMAGLLLLTAALVTVVVWLLLNQFTLLPFSEVIRSGTTLPTSLKSILTDVLDTFNAALLGSLLTILIAPLLLGTLLLAISARAIIHPLAGLPRRGLLALAVIIVVFPVGIGLFSEPAPDAESVLRCNGHAELCDRRLNEVTFPATHNAMSISQYGWWWPSHDATLTGQLEAGIRGLLIDSHYWDDANNALSYLNDLPPELRPIIEEELASFDRLQREGTYLCHVLCSLGGTVLEQSLAEIRLFLDSHPHEVLVIIIQDGITPRDTELAFQNSGLGDYVYTFKPDLGWPTLREMIQQNQRVLVLAEHAGPPPDWYLNAWHYTMETPYSFKSEDELSCAPNRGDVDKPLFLVNHWIERISPDRVDAARLNQYDFLLQRALECQQARNQQPNLIAVNFASIGDVVRVADTLNGIEARPLAFAD